MWDQAEYDLRCEWGAAGLAAVAAGCDAVIIVDVLSFSTCVDVAVGRGAAVLPYRHKDASAAEFARERGALLAGPRGEGLSLSPGSLAGLEPGAAVALPSPNGATLSLLAGDTPTFAGCLRNSRAVAAAAAALGPRIAVIPAGERWPDGSLRPALEDWLGAGSILAALPGARSPEAQAAIVAFKAAVHDLPAALAACGSGRELIARGYPQDVALAAMLDASALAPRLREGAYRA